MKTTNNLRLCLIAFMSVINPSFSQENEKQEEKPYRADIYGFVRTDFMWDTRRSAQAREYHFTYFPLDVVLDENGRDIHATGASNFLSLVTRFGVKASGPDVWGANTSAVLETDFFGSENTLGHLRLRHAYVDLDWEKTKLTVGQTWYPAFIPEVFPGTVNFSTGIPFNPFGWVSQVRVKQRLTKAFAFDLIAYKEREFTTATATGAAANSASFNSPVPTFHGQFQYKKNNFIAGAGVEYKSLKPVIESNGLVSDQRVNSLTFIGYFRYANDKFLIKAYALNGENLHSFLMLGGFVGYNTNQPGEVETYKPIKTRSYWIDIASTHEHIAPGLFAGFSTNDGASRDGATDFYARGIMGSRAVTDIWRVAARVDFKRNKLRISPEVEYNGATWGDLVSDGSVANTNRNNVGNFRAMVSCVYSF